MPDTAFQLELTRPLLLAGLIALPLLAYYFYRSLVDFARGQMITSLVARSLIVVLLVLSLAGLTLLEPTRQQFVVFVMDESLSVGEESRKATEEFLDKALAEAGSHHVAFLPFAAEPGVVQAERGKEQPPLDDKGSALASAIEVAAAAIPPFYVPKIVLLSDGNQTTGDALKAALASGVPVWTVPLKTREDPEVQVSAVNVPAQVQQGEPFYVEVVIDSNHDDEGEIEVYRGPHKVVAERKPIKKGENRFRFRQSVAQERLAMFAVRTRGFRDTLLDNNSDSGLVFTSGKPRVLLVESDTKLAKHLAWAMEEEDIQVDVRPPQGMPESLADLQNYELLVLSNVPATSLTMRQMEVARTYVQDLGGGLIMIGGDQSFGLGGYYKTVLEEILPVRSDFEKEKEKPSLAMVLVIDKSGSMGGQKIELAKDAAKAAVELLGPNDKVGVIAFEGETYWVSEIRPCTDKGYILDRISSIEAGGGTNMAPAMEEAYIALHGTFAKLKHVIIATDGISAPGDFEGITQNLAAAKVTVTTIGIGQDADQNLLEQIAKIGGGRYYFTTDPQGVPQIFAKETVTASKSAINEQPFMAQVIRPTQALAEIDFATAPFLLGYVVTRPKPTCEFVLATEQGDPLLAWWRYGLGMTVAFTSDAKSRWAAEWVSWPGYGKFWAQIIRNAMRKSEAKGFVVEVKKGIGHRSHHAPRDASAGSRPPDPATSDPTSTVAPSPDRPTSDPAASASNPGSSFQTITLDSVDPSGKYLNKADTELTVIDPQLGTVRIPMIQTAPGRYSADFETSRPGAYHIELAQKVSGRVLYRQSRGLVVGYPDELRLRPTDEDLLKSVARVSGGTYDPSPSSIFALSDRYARRATPLWPYLISAAALIFLADVALRRIDFTLIPRLRTRTPARTSVT